MCHTFSACCASLFKRQGTCHSLNPIFCIPIPKFPCGVVHEGLWQQALCRQVRRRAVSEVEPAELEAAIRGGGAVVLDVYAVWCSDLRQNLFCFRLHLFLVAPIHPWLQPQWFAKYILSDSDSAPLVLFCLLTSKC